MRLIDFMCDGLKVTKYKNTYLEIIRAFMDNGDWMSVTDLEKEKFFFVYTKRLTPVLVEKGILLEKENSWSSRRGKPMTRGKLWKINEKNRIIKLLRTKI